MRDRVPGVVHSIAFSLDGSRLWCAHADGIAVRAWPSLELMGLHPLPTTLLTATVNGTFLCATDLGVIEVDEGMVEQRRLPVTGAVAFGLDDHNGIVVVRADKSRDPTRLIIERHTDDVVVTLGAVAGSGVWWSALLPTTKALVLAMDDRPPRHLDIGTGEERTDWDWLPGWAGRDHARGFRSWLSVDGAVDERCIVVSDKGQGSTVIWLDELGRVHDFVVLEVPRLEHVTGWKGPARGAAAAVHPHQDVTAIIDISGRLRVNNARSGGLLDLITGTFSGGYRWEGRRR